MMDKKWKDKLHRDRWIGILGIMLCVNLLMGCGAGSVGETEYTFKANEVLFAVNEKAEDTLEKLGEPQNVFEAPSCAFDGMDRIYRYDHFSIQTNEKKGEEYITVITFLDDLIKTQEGVSIGMTQSAMEQVYGSNYERNQNWITYFGQDTALRFVVEEGKIRAITYMAKEYLQATE